MTWNDDQKKIVNKIEARYGVVVQGPPGTGKSHTIANLLSRFLAQGKSVLVTSQTGKALEVLKDKIPEKIKDLIVSQVESNSRHDDLQMSVKTINANLDDTTKFTDKKIEEIRAQLKEIRKEKAALLSRIKKWVLLDIEEKFLIEDRCLTPTQGAKELADGSASGKMWLKDKITKDAKLDFTEEDITNTVNLLARLTKEERGYFEQWMPEIGRLPKIEDVKKFFEHYEEALVLNKRYEKYLAQKKFNSAPIFEEERIRQILQRAGSAHAALNAMDKKWEDRLFALILNNSEEKEKWQNGIFERLKVKGAQMRQLQANLLGHNILHNTNLSVKSLFLGISQYGYKDFGFHNSPLFIDLIVFDSPLEGWTLYSKDGVDGFFLGIIHSFPLEFFNSFQLFIVPSFSKTHFIRFTKHTTSFFLFISFPHK